MRYCFTSLAINEPYETKVKEFYKNLSDNTKNANFFISTLNENLSIEGDRIYCKILENYDLKEGLFFHYNLKCLSLKYILEWEKENYKHDYIIYTDSDWGMYKCFSEDKIMDMLDYMDNENLDCLFERPALIGDGKKNVDECFYKDKIYDYGVLNHTKWDNAHVVNEQILVFKNNVKFNFFVQRWEQFLWYSINNNIRNYAEGFEIGISILESEMNYSFNRILNNFLTDCFYFYTKSGVLHTRF